MLRLPLRGRAFRIGIDPGEDECFWVSFSVQITDDGYNQFLLIHAEDGRGNAVAIRTWHEA